MGSGNSKQNPVSNSSNNAGKTTSSKPTDEQKGSSNKLPTLTAPQSTTEVKKEPAPSNTKLPHITSSSGASETKDKGGNLGQDNSAVKEDKAKGANPSIPKEEMSKGSNSATSKVEDEFIEPEDQRQFDDAVCSACVLVKPESLMKKVTKNMIKLQLSRALPWNYNFYDVLSKLSNLQEVDISNNNIGPHSFRSVCLAMCNNVTVTSLNIADNMADTDSAESIGKMLTDNKTLVYLNVSSNTLGKDYFSRCVGPSLKINTSLKTLRAQSIGSSDMKLFMEGLKENKALTDIDLSNNALTDRTILGKGFGEKLKDPNCVLKSIALTNCEINSVGIESFIEGFEPNTSLEELNLNGNEVQGEAKTHNAEVIDYSDCTGKLNYHNHSATQALGFIEGFESNKSLQELNLNGNEFETLKRVGKLVALSMNSGTMKNLSLDMVRVKDKIITAADIKVELKKDVPSQLQILSLNDSSLTDNFWSSIEEVFQGRQIPLMDLNIGSNTDLSTKCLDSIAKLTSDSESVSTIKKINYSLNSQCDGLAEKLSKLADLQYVSLRRCRLKDIHLLVDLYTTGNLSTLVLDNIKMGSTDIVQKLMDKAVGSNLRTLSLGGCSLSATEIAPLCQAIKKGIQLHMLKLSANRLEDQGVIDLAQAITSCKTHPLAVLDLSSNSFGDAGAQSLSKIFTTKGHKSQMHSLNVTSNDIGKVGLLHLVSVVGGKSPLCRLYVQNQHNNFSETDMVEVFTKLATVLGFNIKKLSPGTSDMPNLPEGLMVNLSSLGGNTGELGALLDSLRIITDYTNDRIPTMTFGHIQELCACLKNTGRSTCVWSSEEWGLITGASKATTDAPSWLQLSDSRSKTLYLSNLPGSTTQQKMDALFEMEADCNLNEVCLMKDPVTRSINGTGWALMMDDQSIQKAIDFFISGEAKVFGQPFKISKVSIKVDDEANSLAEAKAREDFELRQKQRQEEAQEYRSLIQRTTEESWKRHAYRLAHPAYADGRIW